MTTTTNEAPPIDLVNLASKFGPIASTSGFGVEAIFARWQELRIASARHDADLLADVRFCDVIDAVLDHRANPTGAPFNVLALAAAIRS